MNNIVIPLERAAQVDHFINSMLLNDEKINSLMKLVLQRCQAAELPVIQVSPTQGKLLYLLVKIKAAKRILEIGTLGGYSAIWMGLALEDDGELVTLDFDPACVQVAQSNIESAGLQDKIKIIQGWALASLQHLVAQNVEPFDLIFIDADKENNPQYLELALQLSKSGSVIIGDNVVRKGKIIEENSKAPNITGLRQFYQDIKNNPRLEATAIQTVGDKNWDGFALAVVK